MFIDLKTVSFTSHPFFHSQKSMPKTATTRYETSTLKECEHETSTSKEWFLMWNPSSFASWSDET